MSLEGSEVQRLTEELEKTKEILALRTALLGIGLIGTVWKHNVESSARSIHTTATMLYCSFRSRSDDSVRRYLSMIEDSADNILKFYMAPPLTAKEGLELICVNDLLRACDQFIDPVSYGGAGLKFQLGTGDHILILANRWWMDQVLRIVIENGTKAMSNSNEKVMTISTSDIDGSSVEIRFSDTGSGMSEAVKSKLFKEPIFKSQTQPGLGIGLLIAMTIVQVYDGSIRLLDTNTGGTTFAILLPRSES
jgi:signal transduction histidine kinase